MPLHKYTHKGKLISRRVLALRMLIAQIGWLDGVPVIVKGRVGWEQGGTVHDPDAGDIARAQRRLNKILQDREAAARVVGNVNCWAEEKQQQLNLVKRLSRVTLNGSAADWLIVQSMCVDAPLKILPARIKQSLDWLGQILLDDQLNLQIKTFAAILAGGFGHALPITKAFPQQEKLQEAHKLGQCVGITSYSQFLNKVLVQKGIDRAVATHNVLGQIKSFAPTEEALNRACFRHSIEDILRTLDDVTLLQSVPQLITQYSRSRNGNLEQMQILAKETAQLKNLWETLIRLLIYDWGNCMASPIHDYLTLFIRILICLRCKSSKRRELFDAVASLLNSIQQTHPEFRVDTLRYMVDKLKAQCDELGVGTSTNIVHLRQKLNVFIRHEFEHLPQLLNLCNDASLVKQILQTHLAPSIRNFLLKDTESTVTAIRYLLALAVGTEPVPFSVMWVVQASQNNSFLKETFSRIFKKIMQQPQDKRRVMFNTITDWIYYEGQFLSARERFEIAYVVISIIDEQRKSEKVENWELLYPALMAWMAARHMKPAQARACITWLVRYLTTEFAKPARIHHGLLCSATLLAGHLSGGNVHMYQKIVLTCISKRISVENEDSFKLLIELCQLPGLVMRLGVALVDDTCSFGALFEKYILARRLGVSVVHLLRPLNDIQAKICGDTCCAPYQELPDELQAKIARYNAVVSAGGREHVVPSSIAQLLKSPQSNSEELRYLEKQFPSFARPDKIEKRIAKLRVYRLHPGTLQKEIEDQIAREFAHLESRAYIETTVSILNGAIRQYAFALTGQPTETIGEDDLVELALFRKRLVENRSALKSLIRAALRGDKTWVMRQTKNQQYLKKLETNGIATQHWLNPPTVCLRTRAVPHSPISICVETDALEILQMGNYFETCLSFDGMNAHSPVANACDINKRVIYARDEMGKVIGRKLIAISKEFGLLGYQTYCIYGGKRSEPVKQCIENFAKNLAGLCNLPLHEDGDVDVLVAELWYDDGPVSWRPATVDEKGPRPGDHGPESDRLRASPSILVAEPSID